MTKKLLDPYRIQFFDSIVSWCLLLTFPYTIFVFFIFDTGIIKLSYSSHLGIYIAITPVAIMNIVLLLAWMLNDGAYSLLWDEHSFFKDWGTSHQYPFGRWLYVIMLCGFNILGIFLSTKEIINTASP